MPFRKEIKEKTVPVKFIYNFSTSSDNIGKKYTGFPKYNLSIDIKACFKDAIHFGVDSLWSLWSFL